MTNGPGEIWNTEREEMFAFDRLPREIRNTLNYAVENVSAVSILKFVPKYDRRNSYQYLRGKITAARHI